MFTRKYHHHHHHHNLHLPGFRRPASSTSVGAQCRRQTDTSILSVRAHHTNASGLSLLRSCERIDFKSAMLVHRCLHGLTSQSVRLHPACRRLQSSLSPVVVILAASDTTCTAFHRRRSCVSGGWKPATGTVCHATSHQLQRSLCSGND